MQITPNKKKYISPPTSILEQPNSWIEFSERTKICRLARRNQRRCRSYFSVRWFIWFLVRIQNRRSKGFYPGLGKLVRNSRQRNPYLFLCWQSRFMDGRLFRKSPEYSHLPRKSGICFGNKTFLIGHGRGKGPGDTGYKRMKKVFTNPFSKWLFRWLSSRHWRTIRTLSFGEKQTDFRRRRRKIPGEENEWLILYSKRKLETKHYNYFVFGHRHLPLKVTVWRNSEYVNRATDWLFNLWRFWWARLLSLKKFE